jgi:hypothetical protein
MLNVSFGARVLRAGAGAASRCSSGSTKIMRFLAGYGSCSATLALTVLYIFWAFYSALNCGVFIIRLKYKFREWRNEQEFQQNIYHIKIAIERVPIHLLPIYPYV